MRVLRTKVRLAPIALAAASAFFSTVGFGQIVTNVQWPATSLPGQALPYCPNQLYQMVGAIAGGSQGLTVLNPRTVNWDRYGDNGTTSNGFAYAPDKGFAYAISGPNNGNPITINTVNDKGVNAAVGTPAPFNTNTAIGDNGAPAAGGYDEPRHFYWSARAVTPNIFHVLNTDTGTLQTVDFGTANGSPNSIGAGSGAPGAAQL